MSANFGTLVVSVFPVPAGPAGAPPSSSLKAVVNVTLHRSVRGVMTSRPQLPTNSKEYTDRKSQICDVVQRESMSCTVVRACVTRDGESINCRRIKTVLRQNSNVPPDAKCCYYGSTHTSFSGRIHQLCYKVATPMYCEDLEQRLHPEVFRYLRAQTSPV